jgi:hypothetical protein
MSITLNTINIALTADNTLNAIGNYRIIKLVDPINNVNDVTNVTQTYTGQNGQSVYINSEIRWSTDNNQWAQWQNYSTSDLSAVQAIIASDNIYLEFRFTATSDPNAVPYYTIGTVVPNLSITGLVITVNQTDIVSNQTPFFPLCSDEGCGGGTIINENSSFNPYNIAKATCIFKDLSKMVNSLFGHQVQYYKVDANKRSGDVILKEWTLYDISKEKCLKILVPNNVFPDNKPTYNSFGLDFEQPFEVHLDKSYFEGFFGKNAQPQKRDVLFFPLINRIFEISSAYLFKDFMQQGIYYKLQLIKYQPKMSTTISNPNIQTELNDLTITSEALFGVKTKEEMLDVTKPQQYKTITHETLVDPIRELVSIDLDIIKKDIYNNWTLVSDYQYDMESLYDSTATGIVKAVGYKIESNLSASGELAYTCWINPKINSQVNTNEKRNLIVGREGNVGLEINLLFNNNRTVKDRIEVKLNSRTLTSVIPYQLDPTKWYGVVINISNKFKQIGFFVYEMANGDSELVRLHHQVQTYSSPEVYESGVKYYITPTPISIASIRLFKNTIEEEYHSIVLNQLIVRDASLALIIDGPKPLLRLNKVADPR